MSYCNIVVYKDTNYNCKVNIQHTCTTGAKEGCCNTCADVRESYRQKVSYLNVTQLF